jgi:hypothetical protein
MWINVKSTNPVKEKFFKDSVKITERVRDLFELGAGTTYELVGNPNNHSGTNDPCRPIPQTSLHYENHYGTQTLLSTIQNIAASYDSLYPGIRLRINDMSLEYGGLFDTGNRWRQGLGDAHAEHRIGENADIGFTGIDQQNKRANIRRVILLRIIRNFARGRTVEHDDHFHIRMR